MAKELMNYLGNALILSPFATHPLDAGQRKRAFQTTSLLRKWGFSITFLHFAFETRWYWGHNSEDDAVIRKQWEGDVLHFYASKAVGLPPANGESHHLDEWWDEALGSYISNIFSKRQYDLFVCHNVWLSKAFDYVPNRCLKALEMHDLFSQRAKEYEATGVKPEFFFCSEKDEIFGLRRADLLLAIKQEDADWCIARGFSDIITIPYVEEPDLDVTAISPMANLQPLHPGKVVFGMIGSDIHFNRQSVHALIKELEAVVRDTYAPIEFVLAGSICRSVGECPSFVKKLGFVDHVSTFYSAVDVVTVPMLHGTGVKIKSVEALAYSKPVLFTVHSAEGTGFHGRICQSLREMALWAAQISLDGKVPADLVKECNESSTRASGWIQGAKDRLIFWYNLGRPSFFQLLGTRSASLSRVIVESFAGLALYKELVSAFRPQGIAVQPEMEQFIASVPSDQIPKIQSLSAAIDSWSSSTFAVFSFGQYQLLDIFLSNPGPRLILLDCRFCSVEELNSLSSLSAATMHAMIYLLTPLQASLINASSGMRVVVYPILSDRSTWDPHLHPLYAEIALHASHMSSDPYLEVRLEVDASGLESDDVGDSHFFPLSPSMIIREAIGDIDKLCRDTMDSK
ncbi:glycosyltransferase [Synechococcus sp. RSCCF101]|uniref:glycosyltransferase n=1 Tax=Synechococcus sp. RSCCF101 TaxID=2511069 RepID=UPI00124835C6|nr:glycosyltransferase [Synechococcus sp. RSCCF101]QEY31800.1 glycosyltransferase [Synechococcus sp. RSCCF101]